MKRNGTEKKKLVIALVIGIAALLLLYSGCRWLEERSAKPETRGEYRARLQYEPTVPYQGELYRQKKGLTTILLMGIDKSNDDPERDGRMGGGQADFLQLLVLDESEKTITRLRIDRDTMTPIVVLGVLGNRSGMRTAQISLAHGFGDGREESCELTAEAVSNLLLGIPVDHYIAMNMDGIAVLNDLVGGVSVTLEDDFSAADPAMTAGSTLTLTGEQAEIYVRGRMSVGGGTNEERMRRQESYIQALIDTIDAADDKDLWDMLADGLEEYLVTDLSRGRMINEAWNDREYARGELLSIEGEHRVGSDGFMQFIVDEDSLYSTVMGLFYEPAN